MTKFITKTVEYVFLILLSLILLAMSISLAEKVFSGVVAVVLGLFILAFVFGAILLFRKKIETACKYVCAYLSNTPSWKLALTLGLFSAVTKIIFVFVFNNNADLHPDMAMYRSFASQYADSGYIVDNAGYANKFEYTTIYGLVLSPFAKLFGTDTKVFTVALSVLHSVSMVLLYDILKRYCNKEIAFASLLLYCASPMGLFQTQLLTHENGLFFFHILAFWIFIKALDGKYGLLKQALLVLLSSLVLCIGKSINASGRVFVISFGIYAFVKLFEDGFDAKKAARFACVVISLLLCYTATSYATSAIIDNTVTGVVDDRDSDWRMPYGWPLYVGFNYESNGGRTQEDNDTYQLYTQFDNKEEAYDYQKMLVNERLEFFKESPSKLPIHFFNKIKVLWGGQLLPFAYELGNSANDFVLRGFGGIINKFCIMFNGLLFLILYAFVFVCKVMNLKTKHTVAVTPSLHCQMCVIGVTLALLLFEVMPKHVSPLHVLLFCVFAITLKSALPQENIQTTTDTTQTVQ